MMGLPTAYYQLFLDSELNYSSGYFHGGDVSLEQAQRTKVEAILGRCQLQPSMKVLDVGCGWGAAMCVAEQTFGLHAVGITVVPEQFAYVAAPRSSTGAPAGGDVRFQSWEEFNEPVDGIVCINAFENFTNKEEFLPHCRRLLPKGGRVVMLTVTADRPLYRVLSQGQIVRSAESARFDVDVSNSLRSHYVRTLECFTRNIDARRHEAVRLVDEVEIERHLRFFSFSADLLRRGLNDMFEFTFTAN